ncbi:MAG: hypothetical protein KDC90_11565 [Ignavibacteriae bacterium]|nr:hypothetical protein [Ignavibacteriota bacterium]
MLDKIQNINPQEKYKSGLKIPAVNLYAIHQNEYDREKKKDSALFSPLAKLLSKINWNILAIEYPSEEEILLHFAVDDIEFITVIDFNELYSKEYQEFSIYKAGIKNENKVDYEIKVNVRKDEISTINTSEPIEIDSLRKLFSRIAQQDSNYIIESHLIDEILIGIDHGIFQELNYVLKVICTFITTKYKSKIKNNFILKTQGNIPIIINKIVITNSE